MIGELPYKAEYKATPKFSNEKFRKEVFMTELNMWLFVGVNLPLNLFIKSVVGILSSSDLFLSIRKKRPKILRYLLRKKIISYIRANMVERTKW
jgi:hypothetical protein